MSRWLRGNTHAHSLNSDGVDPPDVVARRYRDRGYDFLFVTDHDHVTDPAPLNAELHGEGAFLVLPGQEVTQWVGENPWGSAHVNALFLTDVVYPIGRRERENRARGSYSPPGMTVADTIVANVTGILDRGGLAQINHPNCLWTVAPGDIVDVPDGTLIEIWNEAGICNNLGGETAEGDARPPAEGFWDHALSAGRVMWGVGADDSHEDSRRGRAWIMLRAAELTAESVRTGLESGDFYASTGVELSEIEIDENAYRIEIANEDIVPGYVPARRLRTRFIGEHGRVLAEVAGAHAEYRFRGDEVYVRASISDSEGDRAWTQPVFFDHRRNFHSESH